MHNPWLTYGIGLHRIREAGLATDLMDFIDERPLSLNELYEWCMTFFVGDDGLVTMRHPAKDWNGFVADLQEFLKQEKMIWNPVKNKLYPWIDVNMLESVYQRGRADRVPFKSSSKVSSDPPCNDSKIPSHRRRVTESHVDPPSMPSKSNSFNDTSRKQHRRRVTVSDADRPCQKSTSFHDAPGKTRRSNSGQDPEPSTTANTFRKAQSFHKPQEPQRPQKSQSFNSKRDPKPEVSPEASHTKPKLQKPSSFHDPLKASTVIKQELQQSLFAFFDEEPEEKNLLTVIKEWSHEPNGKLRPLEMLLFEAPVLLPPNNPLVEHHEYFDKWKTLRRDAFKDDDADKDQLIHKVARKCKIFLHPDKWPTDLNDDQKFLLQSMWDVFGESELF